MTSSTSARVLRPGLAALLCALGCLGFIAGPGAAPAYALDAPPVAPVLSSPQPAAAAADQSSAQSEAPADVIIFGHSATRRFGRYRGGNPDDRVNVGSDTDLPAGEHAHSVVSVFGSASSEGEVTGDVVSIFGNTRVTGTGTHDAVAVLGNTYVDTHIDGDAVAVLGTVELGPHADVAGDVTAVGGTVRRDPGAVVHGGVQQLGGAGAGAGFRGLPGLLPWVHHALLYLRPLGWGPGLGWAWAVALAFLTLYVLLALLAPAGINECERTLLQRPGGSVLTAVLTVLAVPVAFMVLLISVIGIPAIFLLVLALLCVSLFGKAVVLAWLGRRCLGGRGGASHPALAVLIGGAIVLVLYLVPVLGFVVYKLLGLLGLGAVIYTLILKAQSRRSGTSGTAPGIPPAGSAPAPGGIAAGGGAGTGAAPAGPAGSAPADAVSAGGASPQPSGPAGGATGAPQVSAASLVATLPRAGFWIRMAALLLDAILIGVVVHELPDSHNLELLALALYGAVMWKLRGATIGGIVFDLQVMRLDGRELDWTTVIVRALGCFLSLMILGLGFIWIAFDDAKQAWHDKFAGTVVVRAAKAPSLV